MLGRSHEVIGVRLDVYVVGDWAKVSDVLPDKSKKTVYRTDSGLSGQQNSDGRLPIMHDLAVNRSRELGGVVLIRRNEHLIVAVHRAKLAKIESKQAKS